MSAARRLFVDVSYTRTQQGNVGITRTVRRLLEGLGTASDCQPVVYHRTGYRLMSDGGGHSGAATEIPGVVARLFRALSADAMRRVAGLLPLWLLRSGWRFANERLFNAMGAGATRIEFERGDWLVLADQAWNYRAWRAAELARSQGARVILVVYDLIPLRYPQFCDRLFTDVFGDWLRRMLACSDAVLCISAATEEDLVTWCKEEDLPRPRSAHFRLGSDLPALHGASTVRDEPDRFMAEVTPFFAAIGTIEPRKNHVLLLAAFEQLWREGIPVRLLIAGRPHSECRQLVQRLLAHPEQGRRLMTLFDASDAEIAQAYAKCRALVFPSLAEGFGLPLVEARARGCPVIASDLPALKELADPGVFYFPADDTDALVAALREHLAADIRLETGSVPTFTWQQSARAFIAAADAVLEPANATQPQPTPA